MNIPAKQKYERLKQAANALYDAGVWTCDRCVEEEKLWTELRDAMERKPGTSPKPNLPIKSKKLIKWMKKQIPIFAKKVAPIYKQLKWKWQGKIPDSKEIKTTLNLLLKFFSEENALAAHAGGLSVFSEQCSETKEISYGIKFTIDENFYE